MSKSTTVLTILAIASTGLIVACSDSGENGEPKSSTKDFENTVFFDKQGSANAKNALHNRSSKNNTENGSENPFFSQWDTPFDIPAFDKIKTEHFLPAFKRGLKLSKDEVNAIAANPERATFENTIEALEYSGSELNRVSNVFFNLTSANTSPELQRISKEVSPLLSAFRDDVRLNADLFKRVKAIYDIRDSLTLRTDQRKLLEDTFVSFIRGGANLNDEQKSQLREINAELANLRLQFADNVLAENNSWEMVLDSKEQLAGLPDYVISAAAETAKKRGYEGRWVFTTHRASKNPFLIYSINRELREKMYRGYTQRGDNDNANDNKKIAAKIAALRSKKAKLKGYKSHADFVLEMRTAKNSKNVYNLLHQVWPVAIKQAKNEIAVMQKMIDEEGGDFKFRASDWRHYAEKIRKAKYDLDMESTKPYFSLNDTLNGIFYMANRLYGLSFKERFDLPKYHDDVRTFEVTDSKGDLLGIYITDHYVREGKSGGAWMNSYRKQYVDQDGNEHKPIIVNVLNFPRPVGNQPTLLTFGQASTLFHEFGHAAHGLLSDGIYPSQTGTAVPRDFVEFPSQVHQNWMFEPKVLEKFAKHYKTGKVIPTEMVEKIQAASKFNQGFATTEYMAATLLDLAWHTIENGEIKDADEFEAKVLNDYGLIEEIAPRYRTTYFSHIFSGSYSAGYYSYIWADIFGEDAYQAFRENGIFDEKTAKSFVDNILSTGGTDDPLKLYKKFRGKDADPKYFMKSQGLID